MRAVQASTDLPATAVSRRAPALTALVLTPTSWVRERFDTGWGTPSSRSGSHDPCSVRGWWLIGMIATVAGDALA